MRKIILCIAAFIMILTPCAFGDDMSISDKIQSGLVDQSSDNPDAVQAAEDAKKNALEAEKKSRDDWKQFEEEMKQKKESTTVPAESAVPDVEPTVESGNVNGAFRYAVLIVSAVVLLSITKMILDYKRGKRDIE